MIGKPYVAEMQHGCCRVAKKQRKIYSGIPCRVGVIPQYYTTGVDQQHGGIRGVNTL